MSQHHLDGKLHPLAYTSHALAHQEKKYATTEIETLAFVWVVSHFHAYHYDHDIFVHIDHSAVQAVQETQTLMVKMLDGGQNYLEWVLRASR